VFRVHTDVGDLDARADKVAFTAPDPSGAGNVIRRLDLEGGPTDEVGGPVPSYDGIDVGSDPNDHAHLVYSQCDEAKLCGLYTKPFRKGGEKSLVVSRPGCRDSRPSMWKGRVLFARTGPSCDQKGLWLKPSGSSELETVTEGANAGADLNDGWLVWFVPGVGLMAKEVLPNGHLSPGGTLKPVGDDEFHAPLVVDDEYVYFVHEMGLRDYIARAHLPLNRTRVENYVQEKGDRGSELAPHFGVSGDTLYITNYPPPGNDPAGRVIIRVRNPRFERAG
jgi:hypothetical protein